MKYDKKKYNAVIVLLVIIIAVSIWAPTIMWEDYASGEQGEEYVPPVVDSDKEKEEENRQTYNFKTASAALKQGNENLAKQGGHISTLKGGADLNASYAGFVGVSFMFDFDSYKYKTEDIDFFKVSIGSRGLPVYKLDLDNYCSTVSDSLLISYNVDRSDNEEKQREFNVPDFINKNGMLPAENWLNFGTNDIISSRIESYPNYQKVIMKLQPEALKGVGNCVLTPVVIRNEYKITGTIDMILYISRYGDILNAQYTIPSELILYAPFGVIKSTGNFNISETFYDVNYEPVLSDYNFITEKYPFLLPA